MMAIPSNPVMMQSEARASDDHSEIAFMAAHLSTAHGAANPTGAEHLITIGPG